MRAVVEFAFADLPGVAELVNPGGPTIGVGRAHVVGPTRRAHGGIRCAHALRADRQLCCAGTDVPPEVKRDAANHHSHILLDHAGPESDPYERYLALLAIAGSLARFGRDRGAQ